jgi:hypothetical protein
VNLGVSTIVTAVVFQGFAGFGLDTYHNAAAAAKHKASAMPTAPAAIFSNVVFKDW